MRPAGAILAIETAAQACAAAARGPDGPIALSWEAIGRGHAERLAPMVEGVLAKAGLAPGDLVRIGVDIGPGGFAGTRVGVAFARGLALATGAAAVGLNRLDITARALARQAASRPLLVIHDARRGEAIWRLYTPGAQGPAPDGPVRFGSLAEAAAQAAKSPDALLTGSGAAMLETGPASLAAPDPEAWMGALLHLTAKADPGAHPPSPLYARPPDARLPGETP